MNTSDSAEEFVRIYIEVIDKAIRITGVGAKNIGAMLIALAKDKQKIKGKTRLNNMLTIRISIKFSQEAKKIWNTLLCISR